LHGHRKDPPTPGARQYALRQQRGGEDLERLIPAEGPFAWAASLEVVGNFRPLRRHAGTGTDPLRLTFLLDGTFAPVGVALREAPGGLLARIVGTADGDTAARQVARIFSLDHDGSDLALLGDRDPAFGRVLSALPGLRPVCFTSPYECAAWAVISQRIAMRQAAAIQTA
jgi:DNA-3-methyladenine glycosylase II